MSSQINQSELYKVREEYIFIFGGKNKEGDQLSSVEVFDVQREICRLFDDRNDAESFDENDFQNYTHEVCKPVSDFHAI